MKYTETMHKVRHFLLRPIHPSWCFYAGVVGIIGGFVLSLATSWELFDGGI